MNPIKGFQKAGWADLVRVYFSLNQVNLKSNNNFLRINCKRGCLHICIILFDGLIALLSSIDNEVFVYVMMKHIK